jgi:nitrogen-specific signal transduction histidine kinase
VPSRRVAATDASPPELLVAASRAHTLETVLRWMLHDLRNPVQTLHFIPALQEAEADSPTAPSWREALTTACERLSTGLALVDRLVSGPHEPPTSQPVALAEILDFLTDLLRARRGRFEADFSRVRDIRIPAVAAVRNNLEIALLNVLLHSADSAADRAGRVTAQVTFDPEGLDLVLEDDGPGVPEAVRGALFEPFGTDGRTLPTRALRLFAARHLLRASGADLRYEPADPGSRFVVRLPTWRSLPEH